MDGYWREIVVGTVLAAFGFFGKRELNRIDAKVDKADLVALLAKLDQHIKDDEDLKLHVREVVKALTDTQIELAKVVGRLEGK